MKEIFMLARRKIKMEYYKPGNGVACLGCGIANALLETDPETARAAYERIRTFPQRTHSGEILDLYSVEALHHATANRYDGRLTLLRAGENMHGNPDLEAQIQERIRLGLITPVTSQGQIRAIPPSVLFLGARKSEEIVYHALAVVRNEDKFMLVDNGQLKTPQQVAQEGWVVNTGCLNMFKLY